ncbi:MAG: benzoate/toluate 1,2-dioxygenase reductase component, partial [Frankiaceae bacterium]|nr:benzoate/toluate 1,2-dioxygenase reductase component [Frankiaceae bacterium]
MTVTAAPPATHQIALAFEDGVTRFVTCKQNQTVADASYRARINIPVDCSDGACGTCKAFCESGEFDGGDYIDDALSPDEAEQGYVLPCSMKPRSDLVLQIATTSAVAKTSASTYAGRVTELTRLSGTTVRLTVEIDQRDKLAFLPGQYVNISVPGTEDSRSYSFSSAPDEKALSFLIKISPGGVMSEYLTERAGVGDEISFSGPHGSFFLRESPAPLLLLAGGTGLAPILAILRTLEASGTERTLHLVYGATTDDDVVELDTLRQLADSVEGFTWDYCVADKNTQAEHQGYVTTLITPEHLHDSTAAVYLCGPPVMVDAVRKHFGETGLEPAGFYYEKFALAAAPEQRRGEVAEPEAAAAGPVELADEPGTTSAATPQVSIPRQSTTPAGALETLLGRDGRSLCGQEVLPEQELPPSPGSTSNVENAPADATDAAEVTRVLMGQRMFAPWGSGEPLPLDEDEALPTPGTEQPAAVPADDVPSGPYVDSVVGDDGYQIGEEHPSVHRSDAIFDARQGLELGALELVIGRLSSRQLAGYRLLAELTLPYVDGDRFVDAHAYTETNAAFHDYLFTLTGNEHLLRAYQALGVKGHMEESLRNATWCHPRCTQDHLDIVTAFENGDREAARTLVVEHAARSKETTRRAMHDIAAAKRPRFVTPGRFADKVVVVTGAAQGIGERTARRISAEGGTLVLADRAEQVQTLATELAEDGPPAIAVEADLETWEGASAV